MEYQRTKPVCADVVVIWEPNESNLEAIFTVYGDFAVNANIDKGMGIKISLKRKYNDYKMKPID
jgi:hypothetical protein